MQHRPPKEPQPGPDIRNKEGKAAYQRALTAIGNNLLDHAITWEELSQELTQARDDSFPAKEQRPRKDYITEETWKTIKKKQDLLNKQQRQQLTETEINQIAEIKKTIRK